MTKLKSISPREIEAASRALISARKTSLGIEVQMPVVYPTGESVVVVVTVHGGEYVVHDAGFGAMYLTSAGITLNETLQMRLSALAHHYGCDFIEGRMSRQCTPEQIALAMVMVANASRTVGDQALEAKKRPMTLFKREMSDAVMGLYGSKRIRHDETVVGATGTSYRVNAIVLDKAERDPVAFIEAVTDEQAVNRHFREFYDFGLSEKYKIVSRVAIYDSRRTWRPGDLTLLRGVARTVPYANIAKDLPAIAA
jgi:hypothetical protein